MSELPALVGAVSFRLDYSMALASTWLITLSVFVVAGLYSLVGHAGASGYLALMALAGIAPEVMRPAALLLNVFVASIASYKFFRAGCFSWDIFWPFALTSIPFAYLGGTIFLPVPLYKQILGFVLLYSAWRLLMQAKENLDDSLRPLSPIPALIFGAVIGFLSGLTGVGGGIFLSPLLLFGRFANARVTSGVSAVFILANSLSALWGAYAGLPTIPVEMTYWLPAAVLGGFIGAEIGARRLGGKAIRRWLAVVLVLAGTKMILTF